MNGGACRRAGPGRGVRNWAVKLRGACRSDQDAAYENFLHAATVDGPDQAAAFAYLGHHFRAVKREEMKARKCYRRALEIDPAEAGAGAALCALLHESRSEDLVGGVCREILAAAPRAEWARRRLGLHELRMGRPTAAISDLQARCQCYSIPLWLRGGTRG